MGVVERMRDRAGRARGRVLRLMATAMLLGAVSTAALAAVSERAEVDADATAFLHKGRTLFLECRLPRGDAARPVLERYLADPGKWAMYRGLQAAAIPFADLKPEVRRATLLALFRYDHVDDTGWTHYVLFDREGSQETLWTLCLWLTGRGGTYQEVMAHNGITDDRLAYGQKVVFPARLLLDAMRPPTGARPPFPGTEPPAPPSADLSPEPGLEPLDHEPPLEDMDEKLTLFDAVAASELAYNKDDKGEYAVYHLKHGEALYTDVVARFTSVDVSQGAAAAILRACEVIKERSGIRDERSIAVGQAVLIPVEMLLPQYQPRGSEARDAFEQTLHEARMLRGQFHSKDLEGVVVVLDSGHGGRDHGAKTVNRQFSLYEDEINYDIVCRIKHILETTTRATVHVTVRDPVQGFQPTDRSRFVHDESEVLLTTPPYPNTDASTSATLRWYLANSYYRRALAAGVDPNKVVFTSIHCDALYNSSLRGTMIYIPGAAGRRDKEPSNAPSSLMTYQEVREQPHATSTAAERRRDEALSRSFAMTLMEELGKKRVKRHDRSAPIRSYIRRNGQTFVPAVLRNTMIPTKILVETANMTNDVDCSRLADPQWRQLFAEAYVNALRVHFDGS